MSNPSMPNGYMRHQNEMSNPFKPFDLDNYEFKDHGCLLYVPLYNKETGLYRGLAKKLGYIT